MKLIFDVGMHKGEDSYFYLKKGFKVVGFEANPELVELCKKRFTEELKTGQLTIVEGAIVDENTSSNGKISFYKNKNNSVWGTVLDNWAERNKNFGAESEIIEVPTVNFSEYLRKFGIPYYLKIDIEGLDIVCLRALKDFSERPEYVSIESDKVSFDELKNEFSIFNQLGYDKFKIINQSRIKSQSEPKNSSEGAYLQHQFEPGSSGLFGKDLNGKWKSTKRSIKIYKRIFLGYRMFGDNSPLKKTPIGRFFMRSLRGLTGIPGWYDTHAKHSSLK